MQQICLTGPRASEAAAWVLTSLRMKTAGYRLIPLTVDDQPRGMALRMLTAPDEPYFNNVPCMVEPAPGKRIVLRAVFNRIAAPALRQAAAAQVPIFLDTITAESLRAAAFAEAVAACLQGRRQVLAVVEAGAEKKLRAMCDEDSLLWLNVSEENEREILRLLQQELTMSM